MSIYSWNNTAEHSLNRFTNDNFTRDHLTDSNVTSASSTMNSVNGAMQQGMVSELVYNEQHPVMDYILLPMLRQFGIQSRWLLWLSPEKKLSKHWVEQAGLPANKIMQLNQVDSITTIDAMEKALRSGNYSVVLGWLPEISEQDFILLQNAAEVGHSMGFIMRPEKTYNTIQMTTRHQNLLKIHSNKIH
ncbi:TPA: SOS-induced cell division inhibitor SulA [Providencia alcalifaciens]|uniref:Cell division inhibitor SulA n=3 Tax=Providencia alcalifaciens TaxID=126385 RepID=A0AAW9V8Q4_9GAMM|nr:MULTISPECIES: SOS-induced cell division inhibitor SulA [Providencia]EKT65855.1 SOS cell division inhibitor [Providencia alcalifaciens Dmel2]ATG17950.1 cell division inhibitor SulA [Providencia alcalifaciens]EEB47171.1 cell division inhibitor SulA [Providencia alcalifaciens DSM 30120]MBF0691908.1 cell division inhibitor SulA [Providencia alcalifaciens]MTB32477.1 cell division inhibitor SulA [Providencia alcalifaciens]